jgi:hypothetical protein
MRKKGQDESLTFLRKKKGEELTKGIIGSLSSTVTRHPLPSGGTAIEGACRTGTSSSSGGTMIGGLWDFFLQWDHDRGRSSRTRTSSSSGRSRWRLWRDSSSDGLRQRDLIFPNVHALHVGHLLFIVSNVICNILR